MSPSASGILSSPTHTDKRLRVSQATWPYSRLHTEVHAVLCLSRPPARDGGIGWHRVQEAITPEAHSFASQRARAGTEKHESHARVESRAGALRRVRETRRDNARAGLKRTGLEEVLPPQCVNKCKLLL